MISYLRKLFGIQPKSFDVHLIFLSDEVGKPYCAFTNYTTACALVDDYASHGIKANVITQRVIAI